MRNAWAVILAGGEGSRLREVTPIAGGVQPKQFCRLFGRGTLLDETRERVALTVPSDRIVCVLTRCHRAFYSDLQTTMPASLLVEQPAGRGTATAIAFALGRITRTDPHAVVGIFPCDHAFADVGAFARAVRTSYHVASLDPHRLMLVGAAPDSPEGDYGWIEPGRDLTWPRTDRALFTVQRFWEKPGAQLADRLLGEGRSLWNTFITIGTPTAFSYAMAGSEPPLVDLIEDVATAGPGAGEERVIDEYYARLPSRCFSSAVLTPCAGLCGVTPLHGSGWIDVGRPDRLARAQARTAHAMVHGRGAIAN